MAQKAHPARPRRATYTPDYQALIMQDPAFAALQQQLSAQGTTDAAQRQAATEQALIQFGMVPDFAQAATQLGLSPESLAMLQHDIDPHAAALARANTAAGLSTEAGLQQQQEQAIMSLRNALAAHGALSSGDDAYRTNLQDQSFARAQSDALSHLLASIGGYQQNYLSAQQQADQRRQAGLEAAMQFESGLPQNQGFQLHYDVRHGFYRDASGNAYHPHRNPDGSWTLAGPTGSYHLGADGTLSVGPSHPGSPTGNPPMGGGLPSSPSSAPGQMPGSPSDPPGFPGQSPSGGLGSPGPVGSPSGYPVPGVSPSGGHPLSGVGPSGFGFPPPHPHVGTPSPFRPADELHSRGMDSQAALIWQQHHPAAMAGNAAVPPWVLNGLAQGLPGHGPSHVPAAGFGWPAHPSAPLPVGGIAGQIGGSPSIPIPPLPKPVL